MLDHLWHWFRPSVSWLEQTPPAFQAVASHCRGSTNICSALVQVLRDGLRAPGEVVPVGIPVQRVVPCCVGVCGRAVVQGHWHLLT